MADNNLITAHRIGWIIWIYQIIKRIGYHISKAKSVRIGYPATRGNDFRDPEKPDMTGFLKG